MDKTSITALITALRETELRDSISPEGVGVIMQDILDYSGDVETALAGVETSLAGVEQRTVKLENNFSYPNGSVHRISSRLNVVETDSAYHNRKIEEYDKTLKTKEDKHAFFIDLWNEACGIWGRYNEETGYFELNGLTDITYEQAVSIYSLGAIETADCQGRYAIRFKNYPHDQCPARTNLPRRVASALFDAYNLVNNRDFEVINLNYYLSDSMPFGIWRPSFRNSDENFFPDDWIWWGFCKKVLGVIDVSNVSWGYMGSGFIGAMRGEALEDIQISGIRGSQHGGLFKWMPAISAASLTFAIEHSSCAAATVLELHPAAYAKVADEANQDYHSLIASAAEKNITFATN